MPFSKRNPSVSISPRKHSIRNPRGLVFDAITLVFCKADAVWMSRLLEISLRIVLTPQNRLTGLRRSHKSGNFTGKLKMTIANHQRIEFIPRSVWKTTRNDRLWSRAWHEKQRSKLSNCKNVYWIFNEFYPTFPVENQRAKRSQSQKAQTQRILEIKLVLSHNLHWFDFYKLLRDFSFAFRLSVSTVGEYDLFARQFSTGKVQLNDVITTPSSVIAFLDFWPLFPCHALF